MNVKNNKNGGGREGHKQVKCVKFVSEDDEITK